MSYKLYQVRKQQSLQRIPPVFRQGVNTYFIWVQALSPIDVVDGIEQGKSFDDAYKLAPFPLRAAIGTVRGFLKASKTNQQKLREVATLDLTLLTLKYENPETYDVIQRYGDRGTTYVNQWIEAALKKLGC